VYHLAGCTAGTVRFWISRHIHAKDIGKGLISTLPRHGIHGSRIARKLAFFTGLRAEQVAQVIRSSSNHLWKIDAQSQEVLEHVLNYQGQVILWMAEGRKRGESQPYFQPLFLQKLFVNDA
jgi:hypothetical protein